MMMGEKEGDEMFSRTAINEDHVDHTREELPTRFQNSYLEERCLCKVTDQTTSGTHGSTLQESAIQVPDGKNSSDTETNEDRNHTKEHAQDLPVRLQNSNLEEGCPCQVTDQIASANNSTLQGLVFQMLDGKDSRDREVNEDLNHRIEYAQELPVQLRISNLEESCLFEVTDQRASENECILEEFAIQVPDGNDSARGTAKGSTFSSSSITGSGLQEDMNDNGNELVNAHSGSSITVWWESFTRIISAGLYLFDFITTMFVMKQRYDLDYHPGKNRDFSYGRVQGVFPTSLVILAMAHTSNAIAFKLALPREHQPIRSAYFLPLLQLQRLISGLWETGSYDHSSMHSRELQEAEALYAIMGAAIEAAPQLSLQAIIFFQVGAMYTYYPSQTCTPSRDRWCVVGGTITVKPWKPSTIVQLSLISSLISGTWNGGRALRYQTLLAGCKMSYMHAFVGGIYTFAALLLRSTTIATLVFIGNSNYKITVDGNCSYDSGLVDVRFISMVFVGFAVPSILFWVFTRPKQSPLIENSSLVYCGARMMQSSIFGYVSLFLGPLQLMVTDARTRNKLKSHKFYIKLLLLMLMHSCLDIFSLVISITSKSVNPCGPTLDNFTYIGYSPPLSATLKCTRFLAFVITGTTLSILSMITFVFLLKMDIKESIL